MLLRRGTYIVPTNRWYIERAVWLIAGFVLLSSTALALLLNPICILGVVATGLVSINVALTGFCPIGSLLQLLGFTPMLGADKPSRWNLYFLKIDRWYLERRIYVTVGINITLRSILFLAHSQWWALFTIFVGAAMIGSQQQATAFSRISYIGLAQNRASIRTPCRQADVPIVLWRQYA